MPWGTNPFFSIIIIFGIAFIPHFLKAAEVKKKISATGKSYSIANSRVQTVSNIDNSPAGLRIGILNGCHLNGLEAFTYYSIAIISAVITHVDRHTIENAATCFIFVRVVYTVVYVTPALNGLLRTIVWVLGLVIAFHLLYLASLKYN